MLEKLFVYSKCNFYSGIRYLYCIGGHKTLSKSAVASIGQKTFNKGKEVIYQFDLVLKDASEMIHVDDAKEILQNELVRKSEEGFDGITFDTKSLFASGFCFGKWCVFTGANNCFLE